MNSMLHYFAYGSNLHPVRLMARVPSAELVDVVELDRHRLLFHKKSNDGSGKCNLLHTATESDSVYGAIYKIEGEHKRVLDRFEGKGYGYMDEQIKLQYQGKEYDCFAYFAQQAHIEENLKPYHWYKDLVVLGAKYLQFPDTYISAIESIESVKDNDENRVLENDILIEKIINYR